MKRWFKQLIKNRALLVSLIFLPFAFYIYLLTPNGIKWQKHLLTYTFYLHRGEYEAIVSKAERLLFKNEEEKNLYNGVDTRERTIEGTGNPDMVFARRDSKGFYSVTIYVMDYGRFGRCAYDYTDEPDKHFGKKFLDIVTRINAHWSLSCTDSD